MGRTLSVSWSVSPFSLVVEIGGERRGVLTFGCAVSGNICTEIPDVNLPPWSGPASTAGYGGEASTLSGGNPGIQIGSNSSEGVVMPVGTA